MDGSVDLACRPTLVATDLAAPARSPARAQLAAMIDELAAAAAELSRAHEPAVRLAAIIADASRIEDELAALRAADSQRLGVWLAVGNPEIRPEPGPARMAAEARLAARAEDAAAARAALPSVEQTFQRCAETVRELQRQRDEAVCAAAVDAALGFAEKYRRALTFALEQDAVLRGRRDELLRLGNSTGGAPGALAAAGQIGELIANVKGLTAVPHDPEPAQRLLAALVADPDAQL